MVKLSKTSKLGTFSWSLAAFDTCSGSRNKDGSVVPACQGCYARGGFYRFGAAKRVRAHNLQDWKREDWVADMVTALSKQTHFRWFDSGDLYSVKLAEKIYQVMMLTPQVKHWLPTRMVKFSKFAAVIDRMRSLPNVMVRFSSDSVTGEFIPGVHGSVIVEAADTAPESTFVCGAYTRGGKCGDCRACYDREVDVIAYPAHGSTMKKVIMMRKAGV